MQESEQDKAKTDALKMSQDIISRLIAVLLNFTDVHDPFCLVCNEAGMVHLFVEMIKELQDTIPHNLKFVVSVPILVASYEGGSVAEWLVWWT